MSEKKFSTEEMIRWLKSYCLFGSNRDAIIARLRAADKLCEAAKGLLDFIKLKFPKDFEYGGLGFTCPHHEAIRKAIADYEGVK